MPSMVFPGRFASLARIRTFFADAARQAGLDESAVHSIELAADEAAANIIDHAYGGEDRGDIECGWSLEPTRLVMTFLDYGTPFEPESVAAPDIKSKVTERKPRGLGLYFMRRLMDEVRFEFNGEGGNKLTMVKNLPDPQ